MDFLGGTNSYILLKSLHVVAAVAWVGGALTQNIMATRLTKSDDGAAMAGFERRLRSLCHEHGFEPRTVVAGNPARVIRRRYDDGDVENDRGALVFVLGSNVSRMRGVTVEDARLWSRPRRPPTPPRRVASWGSAPSR